MKHYISRYLLVFLFVVLIFSKSEAQYTTGIGLRAGLLYGFSIKQGLDPSNYFEAIYGRKDMPLENSDVFQTVMTLIWEHNTRFRESKFQTTRLCWVYGIGGHYRYGYDKHAAGVDGTIGFEYQFFSVPFTVGIDAKPFYEFGVMHPVNYVDLGATLRFVFGD